MNALVPVLYGTLLVFAARPLRADTAPTSARLELIQGPGGEQCIDQKALARAVDIRLQRSAFREDRRATLFVQIRVERAPTGWAADLTLHDDSGIFLGRRSIVTAAEHCSALDDSLALVLALLVAAPPSAPSAVANDATPPAAASASELPAPVRAQNRPEKPGVTLRLPPDTPARREPFRFELSAGGSATVGLLPGLALGGELGVALEAPRAPELRVFSDFAGERVEQRSDGQAGARFSFTRVGLEVCPFHYPFGALKLFACAGQVLGRLHVAAFGFDQNTTTNSLTYAVLGGTGLKVRLPGPLGARLAIRAEVPLSRGVFSYGTRQGKEAGLFDTKPVAGTLDLGLFLQF